MANARYRPHLVHHGMPIDPGNFHAFSLPGLIRDSLRCSEMARNFIHNAKSDNGFAQLDQCGCR